MTTDPPRQPRTTRRFAASPEREFDAWHDPTIARQWLFASPGADLAARRVEINARVGGKWLLNNQHQGVEILGLGE